MNATHQCNSKYAFCGFFWRATPSMEERSNAKAAKCTRRNLLFSTPGAAMVGALLASDDIHSELASIASRIPGIGQADVFYPTFFKGEWNVTRELYAVESTPNPYLKDHAVLGDESVKNLRKRVGRRDEYRLRFFQHRGRIIEDRGFNAKNEVGVEYPGMRVTAMWEADNPNLLSLAGAGAASSLTREVRVTKRSFVDAPQGYGTFVSSEYSRVVDVDDDGALMGFGRPPSIFGWRRITRYRVSSVSIGANQDPVPDGMDRLVVDYWYAPNQPDSEPVVTLKYREFLNRV